MIEAAQTTTGRDAPRSEDPKSAFKPGCEKRTAKNRLDHVLNHVERPKLPLVSSFGDGLPIGQAEIESNARTSPRNLLIALTRGKGVYAEDRDRRTYADCLAGAGASALGYIRVIGATRSALAHEPSLQMLDLPIPLKDFFIGDFFHQWKPGSHPGTFRGNQLTLPTGWARIPYVRQKSQDTRAGRMSERLMSCLSAIVVEHSCVGGVRGRGLMNGLEIVDRDAPLALTPTLARKIQYESWRRGIMVEIEGRPRAVVGFLPPLILAEDEVDARECRGIKYTTTRSSHSDTGPPRLGTRIFPYHPSYLNYVS